MTRPIIPREFAAQQLAVTPKVLVRYEKLGLVQVAHDGNVEGYEPSQVAGSGPSRVFNATWASTWPVWK